jgi:hypothetical protein
VKERMKSRKGGKDYEVGYRKPPKSGQFRKGMSGNPSGRPKKPSNFAEKVLRELDSKLPITSNGRPKFITKDEAIVKQAVHKAAGGHIQYTRMVDGWRREALQVVAEEELRTKLPAADLTDEDLTEIILADD